MVIHLEPAPEGLAPEFGGRGVPVAGGSVNPVDRRKYALRAVLGECLAVTEN